MPCRGTRRRHDARDRRTSAAPRLAALAAVFPEIVGERAKRHVLRGVVVERAFTAGLEKASVDEAFQVVAQRGCRQIHVTLNVTRRRSLIARLDDEPQDGEAHRVAERAQLLGMAVEFRRHALLLTNSKDAARAIFE